MGVHAGRSAAPHHRLQRRRSFAAGHHDLRLQQPPHDRWAGETSQQTGWYLFTLGAGFDRNGSLTNNVYTGGEVVDYAPNALGQATKVGAYANSIRYHPNGAIAGFNYGNGLSHSLSQNIRGLPDRSRDAYSANVVLDDSYTYDANGNVMAISDGLSGARGDRNMAYDDLDRLTSATSTMFGGTINYTYDVLDNLQTVSGAGRDLRYCYNSTTKRLEFLRTGASNCFTGSATTSFGFDVQGNLAWKNQQNFKFSHDNRLRESVGVATYRYDGQGRRVSANNTTAGGDLSWMYSIDGKVRRMTDARRMKVQHYMYLGDSLVAIREQDFSGNLLGVKYQHTDALGSPVAVTDAATNVVERSEYEPYGKLLNRPINDAPGVTGHVQDADTGLTYMQQRYYDAQVGRFLSVDPVTAQENPRASFNRYWYASGNPYKFTDPDGREVNYVHDGKVTTTPPDLILRMVMSGSARDELKQLEGSKEQYQVIVAPGIDNWYDPEDRVVQINSESDFIIDSTGTPQDPVLNAVHEISHAAEHDRIGDNAFAEKRPPGATNNAEEQRATEVEKKAAGELDLPAREDYQDVRR